MVQLPFIPALQQFSKLDWQIEHLPILEEKWIAKLVSELDEVVNGEYPERYEVLKAGNSTSVLKVESPIGVLVVKYYRKKTIRRVIRNTLEMSRARRSWNYSHFLRHHHIETPEPLVVAEEKSYGLIKRSIFISRYVEAPDLREFFNNINKMTPALANIIDDVANLLINLKGLSISHGDTKATNILLYNNEPCLIDLDAMRHHTKQSSLEHEFRRDLQRFIKNWQGQYVIEKQFIQSFTKYGIKGL